MKTGDNSVRTWEAPESKRRVKLKPKILHCSQKKNLMYLANIFEIKHVKVEKYEKNTSRFFFQNVCFKF